MHPCDSHCFVDFYEFSSQSQVKNESLARDMASQVESVSNWVRNSPLVRAQFTTCQVEANARRVAELDAEIAKLHEEARLLGQQPADPAAAGGPPVFPADPDTLRALSEEVLASGHFISKTLLSQARTRWTGLVRMADRLNEQEDAINRTIRWLTTNQKMSLSALYLTISFSLVWLKWFVIEMSDAM